RVDLLDANTFTVEAMAGAPRYGNMADWRRPVQYVLDHFATSISTTAGLTLQGFDLVKQPTAGPNGIAWEFTAQEVAAMQYVDRLYSETRFESKAIFYLNELVKAQAAAPFTDHRGVVARTVQTGDN